MVERSTVRIRRLSNDRVEEARFGRWLNNAKVRLVEMERTIGEQMRRRLACSGPSELNYQAHAGRTRGLGTVGNGRDAGLFVHPVLAVEADSGACLVGAQVYARHEAAARNYRDLPVESKESMRWLRGALTAKRYLDTARHVTVVADRESDIYEEWDRLPDEGFDLLTRACRDRALAGGGRLYAWSDGLPVAERFALDLPECPGVGPYGHPGTALRRGRGETAQERIGPRRRTDAHASDGRCPRSGRSRRRGPGTLAAADDPSGRRHRQGLGNRAVVPATLDHRAAFPHS